MTTLPGSFLDPEMYSHFSSSVLYSTVRLVLLVSVTLHVSDPSLQTHSGGHTSRPTRALVKLVSCGENLKPALSLCGIDRNETHLPGPFPQSIAKDR